MKIIAPAKVNLMLHFIGRREDGYHLLQSAVAFADIGDDLHIESADRYTLTIAGPFAAHAPAGDDNLVTRAVRWMEKAVGRNADIAVTLVKNIPAGAGLGGGSADAAATLQALNQFWGHPLSRDVLSRGALALGADVPVNLRRTAQWMEGIGEILADVSMTAFHAVLAWPGQGLSTPSMYEGYRAGDFAFTPEMNRPSHIDLAFLHDRTANDFTDIALAQLPVLENILRDLRAQPGCSLARLSGSGSACFGLYATDADAKKAADMMSAAYPAAWVRPCVLK